MVGKQPGLDLSIGPVHMDLQYEREFQGRSPEAYEMLLYEVMLGDQTLFVDAGMVERSWEFIQSILDVWNHDARTGLATIRPGVGGPKPPTKCCKMDGVSWIDP